MFLLSLFTFAYLLVAAFALAMTYNEQLETENRSVALRTLGYVACLFWPVTLVTVALAARASA